MDILSLVKNLLGGDKETKLVNLLGKLVEMVKPLVAEGKLGELVQTALANFGNLGEQFTATKADLKKAQGDEKAKLTAQKDDLLAQIKTKGGSLLDSLGQQSELPEAVTGLVDKAKTMLGKL